MGSYGSMSMAVTKLRWYQVLIFKSTDAFLDFENNQFIEFKQCRFDATAGIRRFLGGGVRIIPKRRIGEQAATNDR